ncbi:hypothetical protein MPSEU_000843800 [Mayamaea pseudoterrestris]|nr:hypothetical protein MPSEU_000843800 [Mayamaea pseudoterrestris]
MESRYNSYDFSDDVPPDMSIEQFLEQELGFQIEIMSATYDAKIDALKSKFETIKEALWQTHADAPAGNFKENQAQSTYSGHAGKTGKTLKKLATKPAARKAPPETICGRTIDPNLPYIRITCIASQKKAGECYIGKEWAVQPTFEKPCKVGRSRGIHFTNKGMSLSGDLEVSTTHAEFGVSKKTRNLYYKDTGSTNGSYIYTENEPLIQLAGGSELELVSRMTLLIGVCIYEITLP